jgi:deoxyribodipyrimidine photo-lyase
MNHHRIQVLLDKPYSGGPVVYWMSRDQRVRDNWALLYAENLARKAKAALAVVFTLAPDFHHATLRQCEFMLQGLEQVEHALGRLNIPFFLLLGSPADEILSFTQRHDIGAIVTDFSPLETDRRWKKQAATGLSIPFHEVDAHNIVPCWIASDKREYAAATIRPRIQRLLPTFLDEFHRVSRSPYKWSQRIIRTDWTRIRKALEVDTSVPPVDWLKPGEDAAHAAMESFIELGLRSYATDRNNPNRGAQSNLSPYLHFGQIAPQRVALEAMKATRHPRSRDAFIEELVVRRELSDNFCYYTSSYDAVDAFPLWARTTLARHAGDKRDHVYSRSQFERAATHDPLWNAAQMEMVYTGKMHGFMRMYWAKKILEWTATPEQALRTAIYLNDKYELDGRDPNGYTGIAWSIGGVHDRAWGERPVYGKIRYMSYDGCRRKFDVDQYIALLQKNTARI